MKNRQIHASLILAMLLTSCQHYEPLPLTQPSLERALASPTPDQLRTRAAAMRHPLLAPVPIDLQNGLTPDAAALVAVIANPSLRATRDHRALASAQLLQAGLLPNPTLDFTLDPVTGGNTQGATTAYNVGLSWEVTALITHDAKLAAARAQSASIQFDVAWQEWQFAQAARKSVYDLAALRGQFREASAIDQRLAEDTELIRKAVDVHQKTLLDLSAAESASQKAHADLLSIQRDTQHQFLILKQALGVPAGTNVHIADSIELPSRLEFPAGEDFFAGLETQRLDLLALRRGYESQEETLRAAVLAQFPKILVGVHQANDNTGVQSTGVGVTLELPIFDRNQGNIAIQQATRRQLFDEYVGRVFDSRSTLAQLLADIASLTEQISAAEKAIPALERLVRTYQAAIEQHNVDVLSYYMAQNDLAQKHIDVWKLKQQLIDNKIGLEITAGRYLPAAPTTRSTTRPATTEAHS